MRSIRSPECVNTMWQGLGVEQRARCNKLLPDQGVTTVCARQSKEYRTKFAARDLSVTQKTRALWVALHDIE
jgi:hypothetical protein